MLWTICIRWSSAGKIECIAAHIQISRISSLADACRGGRYALILGPALDNGPNIIIISSSSTADRPSLYLKTVSDIQSHFDIIFISMSQVGSSDDVTEQARATDVRASFHMASPSLAPSFGSLKTPREADAPSSALSWLLRALPATASFHIARSTSRASSML